MGRLITFGDQALDLDYIFKVKSSDGKDWKEAFLSKMGIPDKVCTIEYGNPFTKTTETLLVFDSMENVVNKINKEKVKT